MLPKSILKFLIGAVYLAYFSFGLLQKDKLSLLDVRKEIPALRPLSM